MLYEVKIQKLDYLNEQLNMVLKRFINQKQLEFDKVSNSYILKNPKNLYQGHQEQLNQIKNQIHIDMKRILESKDHQLNLTINTLKLVNPLNLLEKGYTLISKEQKIIKSSKELKIKDKIEIKMKDGSINAVVEEVK